MYLLVSKCFSGDCPSYVNNILKSSRDIYSRNYTRYASTNLVCPRFSRETEGIRSFAVSVLRLWNALNIHVL